MSDMFDRPASEINVGTGMLKCVVCGHNRFYEQLSVQQLGALLNLGSLRSCTVEVCAKCGHLHWFVFK